MKRYLTTGVLCLILSTFCGAQDYSQLRRGFQTPPQEARPEVWWHWMDGNISQDGILKDLVWMHRSGISGVHIFDAGLDTPTVVKEKLVYMHPEWQKAFRYALEVADSLGMQVTIPSSPGWSATGGPWVESRNAMKRLVWREMRVQGGRPLQLELPAPYTNKGKFQNVALGGDMMDATSMRYKSAPYYEDIAVVAVRLADDDRTLEELGAVLTTSGGKFNLQMLTDDDVNSVKRLPVNKETGYAWLMYEFPQPETFSAVTVSDGRVRGLWDNSAASRGTVLEVSDDGEHFREVAVVEAGGTARQTIAFAPVRGRFFRLRVANPVPDQTMAAYGAGSVAPKYSKIAEFNLYRTARVHHAEEKAGFASPRDLHQYPTPESVEGTYTRDVLDLTSLVKDGVLEWNAPEGKWKILRFGFALTGKVNHPTPLESTGLEVDKLDPVAWEAYFRHYFDMYKAVAGHLMGARGIRYVLTDSYEADQQTWTPAMMAEFKARRGYDLLPWMPVLTGEIIGSVAESERFLFDWRKTIGELIAENYDRLSVFATEYGMKGRYSESHENGRVYMVDGMDVKRSAEVPMAACWMPNDQGVGSTIPGARADIRESASVAHIFGQNVAAAESFTATGLGGRGWSYAPGELKQIADLEMSEGLNRFVIHESAHQPVDSLLPGLGLMTFGQWFNRNDTWAEEARAWTDYLGRSSYLLQQGRFVADVLIYYGEDTNVTGKYTFGLPEYVPAGYSYDFINPTGLIDLLSVKDGRLETPSGMSYAVLCVDDDAPGLRSAEVSSKLEALRQAGAVICTPETLASALEGVPQDAILPEGLRFVHRHAAQAEIYWVNKPGADFRTVEASFRVQGLRPQLWHPETGLVEDVTYRQEGGRTLVTLHLVNDDAVFVVFSGKARQAETVKNRPVKAQKVLEGPWKVQFQAGRGAPGQVTLPATGSLTESADFGVKYFSGTAVYSKNFTVAKAGQTVIDLGEVADLAHVWVNGIDCGTVWKAPFTVDVTEAVKKGENTLRIEVTNVWSNRIIGDLQENCPEKITWTSMQFYRADTPLRPSGLLGPVSVKQY
ncbi:MAG: hypothetical protein IJ651_03365 [Bacteroidales bacterium]|nr:hypothetical protein [Bacteroidales bacterium]